VLRSQTSAPSLPAFVPAKMRPRVATRSLLLIPSQERTRAVRGHLPTGSAVALILEPAAICLVSADRARRRRVRRFAIPEVMSVEEHRMSAASELTIVTAHASITVVDVEIGQAWLFCREVRQLILAGSRARILT
jgi:hypothetical protein